ncbi:MAG TPA: 50S ribosomal protein L28 [bacterium]|jgi:large subunit ribosomal protein L28|nr:50S ribosomal protein L28 [bacterium]
MSRVCEITGSRPNVKNMVSHANNRVKSLQLPNLQQHKIFIPELKRNITLRLSTRALRTLKKQNNVMQYLKENGIKF